MSSQNQNLQNQTVSFLNPVDQSRKLGIIFFSVSILLHCLFFFGVMFFQNFKLSKPMPPVIQIDLVSFVPEPFLKDSSENSAKPQKDEIPIEKSAKKKVVKKKSRGIPTIKADISLKTKPKN